ncbi:Zn(2)-C6 fungal-type DNA-binding domain-containing protein [Fusarium globosum]|uniref:Zn(2)-C6 fungal-type DNA-binding domain-containing protein n=1 Tax=Fusarium globosum TaxID=78864 RepID=A0A8H5YFV8_9HYPO|nr:Zn(2)-C6 fungal-type DNA-binding domain-containing protein [Fusarium globosum]
MDLRDVLQAPASRPVALPSQQSPGVRSSNPYRRYPPVNTQKYACIYSRKSHMACDLERPCTRCIKRNIGHLCHSQPLDIDSQESQSVQAAHTVLDSNLRSGHYTISRDHTEGAEEQKYKILADFGRKHIRAWASLSFANVNSPMPSAVMPLTFLERARSAAKKAVGKVMHPLVERSDSKMRHRANSMLLAQPGQLGQNNANPGLQAHAAHGGLSNYAAIYPQNRKA